MRQAETSCRQQGIGFLRPRSILVLADVEARTGRTDDALRSLDELADENRRTRQTYNDAELHRLRGNVLRLAGRPARMPPPRPSTPR